MLLMKVCMYKLLPSEAIHQRVLYCDIPYIAFVSL